MRRLNDGTHLRGPCRCFDVIDLSGVIELPYIKQSEVEELRHVFLGIERSMPPAESSPSSVREPYIESRLRKEVSYKISVPLRSSRFHRSQGFRKKEFREGVLSGSSVRGSITVL